MKLVTVVGARPQFIKAAVLSRLIARMPAVGEFLIHTGQHYDANMSDIFFRELEINPPHATLHAGAGSHAEQTAQMLVGIETLLRQQQPDAVIVYGDTNSTLAGALAAAKLQVPVAHIEAGLRSFDRAMPEEINRCVVDHVSTWQFCPTEQAVANLQHEGITRQVYLVGDVMYDALLHYAPQPGGSPVLQQLGLEQQDFALCTLHRAGNTDDLQRFGRLWSALGRLAQSLPIVLPLHPRTRKVLHQNGVNIPTGLHIIDPVGYRDMVRLEKSARLIVTDSGGVQKEAYFHGVPCLTLRDNTEWTETITAGWNCLVGDDGERLLREAQRFLHDGPPRQRPDLYGDGRAGEKILHVLAGNSETALTLDKQRRAG
jgi:UDP-N-acetylglucosamine 2-epimerase